MARSAARYYGAGRLGRDFLTAPHVSPAFGHLIGRALRLMWRAMDGPSRFVALELGAGDGRLARDVRAYLAAREPGAAITYLACDAFDGRADVQCDAAALPFRGVEGCVLSNELFDALPVHRLTSEGELWVEDGRFMHGPLSSPELAAYAPGDGALADVSLEAERAAREIARVLRRGYVVTIDYGATTAELRAPHRRAGTALAYRAHRATADLLAPVGSQDLTAHVDFEALRAAGEAGGLTTLLETTQRDFLLRLGLRDWLERLQPEHLTTADLLNARQRALELIGVDGFGRFRVLVQGRSVELPSELQPGTK